MNILLLGANGQVGWELQRALSPLGEIDAPSRADADLSRPEQLADYARGRKPDIIINAAAYTAVDRAESETELVNTINATAPTFLAQAAVDLDAWLVHYSTDYVFDGEKSDAYIESDECAPVSQYGRSKRDGEVAIAASGANYMIFRTSWVHSPHASNFVKTILRLARERDQLGIVDDQIGAPTGATLIADITALAIYRIIHGRPIEPGIYHLAAAGSVSWHGVAKEVLTTAVKLGFASKIAPDAIRAIGTKDYPTAAQRPSNSCLDTSKLSAALGIEFPDWRQSVKRTVSELVERSS